MDEMLDLYAAEPGRRPEYKGSSRPRDSRDKRMGQLAERGTP
jgi:hypothetical protein